MIYVKAQRALDISICIMLLNVKTKKYSSYRNYNPNPNPINK